MTSVNTGTPPMGSVVTRQLCATEAGGLPESTVPSECT